jgi:hypothetical protein
MNSTLQLATEILIGGNIVEVPGRELADTEVILVGGGEVTGSTY